MIRLTLAMHLGICLLLKNSLVSGTNYCTCGKKSTLIFQGSNLNLLVQPLVVKSSGTTVERSKRHPT